MVHQEAREDVYHGRARIPELFRGCIKEGRVCKISVGSKNTLLEVRGTKASTGIIKIGDLARQELAVKAGESYTFCIREVWWVGQLLCAWKAADSASRIAARLGVLGLVLGMVGVILGVIALCH